MVAFSTWEIMVPYLESKDYPDTYGANSVHLFSCHSEFYALGTRDQPECR
jgi:hypothetical protein